MICCRRTSYSKTNHVKRNVDSNALKFGTLWNGMERYGTVWNGMERYGTVWNDVERCGTLWNETITRCNAIRYGSFGRRAGSEEVGIFRKNSE